MNKIYLPVAVASVIMLTGCGSSGDHSHEDSAGITAHQYEHGDLIELDSVRAVQFGVSTEVVSVRPVDDVLEVAGEIIRLPGSTAVVTAPGSGKVALARGVKPGSRVNRGASIATVSAAGMTGGDAAEAAMIELRRAKAELDRVTPLRELGIVTAQEFAEAKNAYDIALNATASGSIGGYASSPISGVIQSIYVDQGQYVEAGDAVATIVNDNSLALRADVPLSMHTRIEGVRSGRFRMSSGATGIANVITGNMPATTTRGYESIYLAVDGDCDAVAGDFAKVYLLAPGEENAISVPLKSITERLGQKFVYVRHDSDHFERRPVEVGLSDGERAVILSGISEGDEVVVEGATFVRLAETSGAVPEGHSHNH